MIYSHLAPSPEFIGEDDRKFATKSRSFSSSDKYISFVLLDFPNHTRTFIQEAQRNQCEYTRSHFRFKHFGCNMYSLFQLHLT
ncbi:hypothetical protein Hanom_Chr07g00643451 [Helianthus anomalus]